MNSSHTTDSNPHATGLFATTQWTAVLASRGDSPQARQALSDLCAAYYQPVFVLIRRAAASEETACDLTQEFFARLLAGHGLAGADPARGRFRSFLQGAVRHFLSDARDRQRRLKRGGGRPDLPLESEGEGTPATLTPGTEAPNPDAEFDRQWAVTLLARALARLAQEQAALGNAGHFEVLKPWLTGDAPELSRAEAAERLCLSPGALKVAIHRLRLRFRNLVKAEIAGTIDDPAEVRDELRYLLEVLSAT